mgnify:FL=1
MSKWQNPSWQYLHPPQGAPSTWTPAPKPETFPYGQPIVGRPLPPTHAPAEYEATPAAASGSPPKLVFAVPPAALPQNRPESAADESVPRPMMQQPPYPHLRGAYAPMPGQYAPMPVYQYQYPPPEYGPYPTHPVHPDSWEPPVIAPRHPMVGGYLSAPEQPAAYERRLLKDSSTSSTNTDLGPRRDLDTSTMGSLLGLAANRITKRSRMGCLTCRQRKKRCCETRPQCTECSRLRLKCVWPKPGTEHKNKPKEVKCQENMIDHETYGKIKVLRGIVEYRSD